MRQTPLHAWHTAHGGRMVEFGGWSMPVQYSTITDEHQAVRNRAGLFDIGHMGRLRFTGTAALGWLESVTTNRVGRLEPGQIQYSLVCNPDGGVIDDILVYRPHEPGYLVVCNASNRDAVVAQFQAHAPATGATLDDQTLETAMIAVQGPRALEIAGRVVAGDLAGIAYYGLGQGTDAHGQIWLVSRTGYTGEDGFELIGPANLAVRMWESLLAAGADAGLLACGLGARDTLRFEAGMPLYGHELAMDINPFEAGLGWAVKLGKLKGPFVGSKALTSAKAEVRRQRIGLSLEGKRIARQGATVLGPAGTPIGTVTSGTFAPTLGRSLAMALVDAEHAAGPGLAVDIRGHVEPATVVPIPFYKRPGA